MLHVDSPRLRTNLRVCPSDDILCRRSNSLRQSLGQRIRPHDEIGLPLPAKQGQGGGLGLRTASLGLGETINVEVTPPSDNESEPPIKPPVKKSSSLQGTIV